MKLYIAKLKKLDVYAVTRLPAGRKAISARWVFAMKNVELQEAKQVYKARYVGKGFQQQYGRDYDCTWSPTVRLLAIHMFLAIGAARGLGLVAFRHQDAYLRAWLKEAYGDLNGF